MKLCHRMFDFPYVDAGTHSKHKAVAAYSDGPSPLTGPGSWLCNRFLAWWTPVPDWVRERGCCEEG